jgi:putative N6-adenine-specific DNA methylase
MDQKQVAELFAITSPGLEKVCAEELRRLGVSDVKRLPGGVEFTGRLADLYRANLWLRSASRVVVRFPAFSARDFPTLFRQALRLPWGRFVKPTCPVIVRVTSRQSRLMHTGRVADTLNAAVNRVLGRTEDPRGDTKQLILARIVQDQVQISIDSSGALLHRRGYRHATTCAPLRETLAAGVLQLLAWDGQRALCDPMCGSGTFLWEAALIAGQQPPGRHRSFAFMHWPGWRAGLWHQLCQNADQNRLESAVPLMGYDQDASAVAAARDNGDRLGLHDRVTIQQKVVSSLPVDHAEGLVVCNPPYGLRLPVERDLTRFYHELAHHLRRAFPCWRLALLCPDSALLARAGLKFEPIATLDNGGIKVSLVVSEPR